MDKRTEQHLRRADRFRRTVLNMLQAARTTPRSAAMLEWGMVIAFHAALQYVSALAWEKSRWRAETHGELREAFRTYPTLRAHQWRYGKLLDHSWQARYEPEYSVEVEDLALHVEEHLALIREGVLRALGQPFT